jgi:hypothetical protein
MKYLCLIFLDEQKLKVMSKSEVDALNDETFAYDEALRQSGHLLVAQALQSAQAATTLRVRNGKFSITDGPFAETNEQLGGFILIEATDLNAAIQMVSKSPLAPFGSIEVRPIMEVTRGSRESHY